MVKCFHYNDPKHPVETKQWEELPFFPQPDKAHSYYDQGVIAVNGHLYISHGMDEGKTFYKFDPCAARWDPVNFRHLSIGCALVYLDGWIYALGGIYDDTRDTITARRYNIRDDKEEVLYPDYESITYRSSAVAYVGKVLVFSRSYEHDDNGYSKFTLAMYDPVINRWFVILTEKYSVDVRVDPSYWNVALVIHENKCFRVLYESIDDRRENYVKPRVNELIFDFEGETPSCRLGESQEQFGFTKVSCVRMGRAWTDQFCINGELYMFVNRYPLKAGHRMTVNEDIDELMRKWEGLYQYLDRESAVTHYTFDMHFFESP